MKKVVLVDNQVLVRSGIRALLGALRNVEVAGEAANCEQAWESARREPVDAVLLEWRVPGMGGLELTRRLSRTCPQTAILVVSSCTDEPFASRLLEAGATGLLCKNEPAARLLEGVSDVLAGRTFISPGVAQKMAQAKAQVRRDSPFDELSAREMQVMLMSVAGWRVQDISESLCLSPKTVSTYRYRLFDKLGVRGEVDLTHLAMRYGLLETALARFPAAGGPEILARQH